MTVKKICTCKAQRIEAPGWDHENSCPMLMERIAAGLAAALHAIIEDGHQDCGEPGCETCVIWQRAKQALTAYDDAKR